MSPFSEPRQCDCEPAMDDTEVPETEAAKWISAIIRLNIHTCSFSDVT